MTKRDTKEKAQMIVGMTQKSHQRTKRTGQGIENIHTKTLVMTEDRRGTDTHTTETERVKIGSGEKDLIEIGMIEEMIETGDTDLMIVTVEEDQIAHMIRMIEPLIVRLMTETGGERHRLTLAKAGRDQTAIKPFNL
mmetsp:Transcript_37878/g.61388  ORF Transcript_37878/g.61388 Transcript_37878/m.61388 type:complete len:137 (-) Transcript_37878:31-441(-)